MKRIILGGQAVIAGRGSLDSLREINGARAFIVTGGNSMFANGTIAKIEQVLQDKKIETYVYSGIGKNPDTGAVLGGLEKMRELAPDVVIAVGGGSPIDAAKVMALMYDYPDLTFDNMLTDELPQQRRGVQFIAIPSTSGTGSEVTRAAVITFRDQNLKIGLKTDAFVPDLAILDADITMSMPPHIVAETGMDAVTHAVECYINKSLDDFSEALARGAVAGLLEYLPVSYRDKTPESREKVHHYQCMAGLAFANVGLGVVHGIAHAVGGQFDLGHGLINAVVLPYALKYNSQDAMVVRRLARLAREVGCDDFISAVEKLNDFLNIPKSLRETGITEQEFTTAFDQLVENSLKGSTRVNPIPVTKSDMAALLKCIYSGTPVTV
ncbi:iron-containing alcohol dehydrogenase [Thermosinus carboxydivorans Nor1]|uniref:Iron-containing alcohol dehydrogenase n=1 Tax=Thermosinus carboxydivorans Nor1 TaxID=401526 RepID=A1HNQ8_9FIRM|nr:iron-containing alcohol dehydrogenase [Thermosinus carboxydivorans]EAX48411.1 iron-containing alcohol dehydrogenase [Thermosinus carboxydivorans Nor1]